MVSVLIPNYNNAHFLPKCIESCLAQGNSLKEIVIVDDGSTDNSWEVLERYQAEYQNLIKISSNPKKGGNHARNYAMAQSSGEYIQWLDSDDFLLKGKFDSQLPALMSNSADIIYSDWRIDFFNKEEFEKSEQKKYYTYDDFLLELIKDNWTSPNNYLLTREFALKLDNGVGWNPETRVGQDREYFTMAGILGARFKYVAGTFAVYNKKSEGTVSGMSFDERLVLNQKLENRFRKEIDQCLHIDKKTKKKYQSILDTHLIKACFYNSEIRLTKFINPASIHWGMMHWKMRVKIPYVYFIKHLQLLF